MDNLPILNELVVVAVVSVIVTVVLSRLRLPTVAGLLAAGALVGPYGLHLTKSLHAIETLAELGVVLLLFSIGLEFSLDRLKHIFRQVALGGLLQVGVTIGVVGSIAVAAGQSFNRAIFYGFVFALSSTAIVLRALTERRELDAPQGRFIVGVLIFQDLCVVPMVLTVPLLVADGGAGMATLAIAAAIAKAAAVVIATVLGARFVVPRLLGWVDASRSRDVFLIAILALCIGTAWLTAQAGLSLALGAFLGGMVVADTEYGRRAMGDILPLRDTFVSLFFVSLGMLFDPRVVIAQPLLVAALLFGFVVIKGAVATVAAMAMRFPSRVAWLAGAGLAQFGEFGFVLTRLAQSSGLVDESAIGPVLAAGLLSMFLTPLLLQAAPHVTAGERLLAPLGRLLGVRSIDEAEEINDAIGNHVVVVGLGLAGRHAARALREVGVDFLVLELNAENVRRGRDEGLPVYYADATSEEALSHARVRSARLVVLLMNDPQAAERVVDTVRRVAPETPILMRTRYLLERDALLRLGARDVVAEEVEGMVEVIARMLQSIQSPRNVIDAQIRTIRKQTQSTDRKQTLPRRALAESGWLDELKIESAVVERFSLADGASSASLKLRSRTGALVVGVRRGVQLIVTPAPELVLQPDDTVYLVGTGDALAASLRDFSYARDA